MKAMRNTDIDQPEMKAKEQLDLGRQLLASGSCARARKHFRKAIQICPDDAQLYLVLGQSFFFQKKPNLEEAIRLTETANRAMPNKDADLFLQALRKKLTQRHKDTK